MSDTAGEPRPFAKNRTSETVLQRITALRAPRKLQALELALLVFAVAIGVGAIVIIDLTLGGARRRSSCRWAPRSPSRSSGCT